MKNVKRIAALLLSLCMVMGLMAGCGSSAESAASAAESAAVSSVEEAAPAEEEAAPAEEEAAPAEEEAAPAEEAASAEEAAPVEDSAVEEEAAIEEPEAYSNEIVRTYTEAEQLPLVDEPVTLTAWDYVVPPVMEVIHDYGVDGTVYAELQNRTGVTLEFTTANLLTASDSMSLMVNANELPDIIFDFGMFYSNNYDDLAGEIIVDYTDYEDIMPNYFDIINNNPSIARDLYTEGGAIVLAGNIQSTLIPSSGPSIRQDWLDADGLEVPVTIDDLYEVLKTFQSENDSTYPFWIAANGNSSLNSAFGISYNGTDNGVGGTIWDEENGTQYCVLMDGFKDYVQLMADWYSEGLISRDFMSMSMNNTAQDSEIISDGGSGQGAGFFTTSVNGLTNLSAYIPESDVEPISAIVQNEGDLCGFDDAGSSRVSKGGAAVACSCPDVELACRIIDYLYSEDGILLCNYGVEGETFEYNDEGEPELTELVTNNPDYDFTLALIKYTSSTPASICINERNFMGYTDAQVKALELWMRNTDSVQAPGSLWEADAQTEYSSIMTDLTTYVTTATLEFITGSASIEDGWDAFIDNVNSYDIDRLIELSNEAVDAYLAKGQN